MKQTKFILTLLTLTSFIVACQLREETKNSTPVQKRAEATSITDDTCSDKHDTTFHIPFLKDTSTYDFYQLLNFIESKGEFSRYDRKHKITSSTESGIWLQKLLCYEKFTDSPKENWFLDNIFSINYYLTSGKPINGNKNIYPRLNLIQYNFKTEAEKEKALSKLQEVGWGDPLLKWNEYYLITSKTRIIILVLHAPVFTQITEQYRNIIQKEWIDKYNY